jgi:hypothetical protein
MHPAKVLAFVSARTGWSLLRADSARYRRRGAPIRIGTFVGDEIAEVNSRIEDQEIIAAVDVRGLLRALSFDPGSRRLGELGPPQKTIRLNKRGGTLEITTEPLVRGSCRIGRPCGD